ncbi:hypothetical protein V6N13_137637 [Hibiscus sabdariffa]|uniref:Uncharacterized protein n=1 Tax=Hibiscus sabdariffa TaxID=183260 RepID=A0ABR2DK10_9ROSI
MNQSTPFISFHQCPMDWNPNSPVMGKPSTKPCSNHDLDLVKAAAWAWHQHGSSSPGKPVAIPESDVTRSQRDPGPSRYKLEAMRNNYNNNTNTNTKMEMEGSVTTHNSLLDPYEIESISKRLDQLMGLNGVKFYHELLRMDAGINDDHPKKKSSSSSSSSSTKWKGFLQRRAVVCGRNHEVEETALRPKNHVAAAKTVNFKAGAADVW